MRFGFVRLLYLFLTEVSSPLFIDISLAKWQDLQVLIQRMTAGLWLTNGSILSGANPTYSIASGLLRRIKAERHQARLAVSDLEENSDDPSSELSSIILRIVDRALAETGFSLIQGFL